MTLESLLERIEKSGFQMFTETGNKKVRSITKAAVKKNTFKEKNK